MHATDATDLVVDSVIAVNCILENNLWAMTNVLC